MRKESVGENYHNWHRKAPKADWNKIHPFSDIQKHLNSHLKNYVSTCSFSLKCAMIYFHATKIASLKIQFSTLNTL